MEYSHLIYLYQICPFVSFDHVYIRYICNIAFLLFLYTLMSMWWLWHFFIFLFVLIDLLIYLLFRDSGMIIEIVILLLFQICLIDFLVMLLEHRDPSFFLWLDIFAFSEPIFVLDYFYTSSLAIFEYLASFILLCLFSHHQ